MNTKSCFCRMLVALMGIALIAQAPAARAGIVSTADMAAQVQTDMERVHVQAFLDRANVRDRVQAMGVGGIMAKNRVAALSDQEVHTLAQKLDSMPAGGRMSDNDWLWVVAGVAILLVIVASHGSGSGSGMGGY